MMMANRVIILGDLVVYPMLFEKAQDYPWDQNWVSRSYLFFVKNRRTNKTLYGVISSGASQYNSLFDFNWGGLRRRGMSGCETYDYVHVTMSGRVSLEVPVLFQQELPESVIKHLKNQETRPEWSSEINMTNFMIMFTDVEKDIIVALLRKGLITPETQLGYWEKYRPLVKTYFRSRHIWRDPFKIVEEPNSFRAKLEAPVKLNISKGHYKFEEGDLYHKLSIGKYRVYYHKNGARKVIYWYDGYRLHGVERYGMHEHPECEIEFYGHDDLELDRWINILIRERLGDLLFVYVDDAYEERKRPLGIYLIPARKEQLEKVIFNNAEVREVDENGVTVIRIKVKNPNMPIQVVHPEHGMIELWCSSDREYAIYQVPYIHRGHD